MPLIQMKLISVVIVLLAANSPAFAQKKDDWWKMSDQKPAPRRSADEAAVNAIKWSFPAPGQVPVEIGGNKLYQLTSEIFGMRTTVGPDKNIEAAAVIFTAKMVEVAQLSHIAHPEEIPNVDGFLVWTAVHLAVDARQIVLLLRTQERAICGSKYLHRPPDRPHHARAYKVKDHHSVKVKQLWTTSSNFRVVAKVQMSRPCRFKYQR